MSQLCGKEVIIYKASIIDSINFVAYIHITTLFNYVRIENRALPINRKQKVFPNGTLIIENVERNSDQATYTCVAKNAEGYSARGALEIQVMGKLKLLSHNLNLF